MVCGEGWLHPDVDYFDDPEGAVTLRHVDEAEIVLDAASIAPDASDARRLTRQRWLKDDELEAMFPGALERLGQACAMTGQSWRESDGAGYRDIYSTPGRTDSKVFDTKKREWLVLEHWWYEIALGYAALNPETGAIEELTLQERDAPRRLNPAVQMTERPVRRNF